ncbi:MULTISPECIES: MFS transporter [Burkholderiaceae]|uniref:MFS transporter n=1 Tax=Burkholderiaceae TaxID=119060 RepID=UPI001422646F|nr:MULTISPECIES: MFS transporter [Burkholderiaceae]MBN3846976.1 MFS transporter [Paraburkholderia sp. Ac-20342]NIF54873.1 MFS transporter [Burkholderia sp. Ax-1724]
MSTSTKTITDQGKTAVRWKIFFVLLVLVAINYIDRASLSVAMPLISKDFDIDPAIQGLLFSSFFWTYALMQVPGGMLADRFKPRIVITVAAVCWGACQAIAGLCTNGTTLLLTRFGLGAAEAPIYPSGGKLNRIWMTRHERGRGATLLDGGAPLGAALGALLIASLIGAFGSWRIAFAIAGVGTVLAGLFAWYFIRNDPREHPGVNEAEALYIERAHEIEAAEEPTEVSGRRLDLFKYRSVWLMCAGYMCANIVFYGLLTWMPNYLSKVHGFNIQQMGGASFIIFGSGFVGELVGGFLSDKWKTAGGSPNKVMRTLLGFAAIIVTAAVFSVAYSTGPVLTVVLLSITLFFQRWTGLYWSIPSLIGTRDKVGLLGGLMNLGGNIGGVLVPLAVGIIVQLTGSYFLAMMVFAGAGVGLLLCSICIDFGNKIPV